VPIVTTHSILNKWRNTTQDINDKIFLSFSHSKCLCHCSRDVTVLIYCAAFILGGGGGCVTTRISEKMMAGGGGAESHISPGSGTTGVIVVH
jgi:hypothetical protein